MRHTGLKSRLVDLVAGFMARSYYVTQVARRVAQSYDYDGNADMQRNGETALLRRIVERRRSGVFVDIGANRGDWSAAALNAGFAGRLVLVDPLPRNIEGLRNRFATHDNVSMVQYAVSDGVGEATFYSNIDEKESGTDSLFNMQEIGYDSKVQPATVVCSTVDRLASEVGVTAIDFLKVDVEGNELAVLKGAALLLAAGQIDFIQLEFGHASRAARVYMHDIVHLADGFGYDLFVIKPRGLMPLRFTPFVENRYSYVNVLMVRRPVVSELGDALLAR